MSCDLNSKNAVLNSAKASVDTARAEYMNCVPVAQRSAKALEFVADQQAAYNSEKEQLNYMANFVLRQLEKEIGTDASFNSIRELATQSKETLHRQIDEIKADISKERRIFLDSDIQNSPAVGGLYFTKVPDNKILIAFLCCLGSLLLFGSLLLLLNHIPLEFALAMTMRERIQIVVGITVGTLFLVYISLYTFT